MHVNGNYVLFHAQKKKLLPGRIAPSAISNHSFDISQPGITYLKLTIETLEQDVKHVQS